MINGDDWMETIKAAEDNYVTAFVNPYSFDIDFTKHKATFKQRIRNLVIRLLDAIIEWVENVRWSI